MASKKHWVQLMVVTHHVTNLSNCSHVRIIWHWLNGSRTCSQGSSCGPISK